MLYFPYHTHYLLSMTNFLISMVEKTFMIIMITVIFAHI